jgi:Holliday junction resolvase RusA-like endonuclease
MIDEIQITVEHAPPGKSTKQLKARAQQAKEYLIEETKLALERYCKEIGRDGVFPWNPLTSKIELEIHVERHKCEIDAANIIGALCDVLQGVLYANDRQIASIVYNEQTSGADGYSVSVRRAKEYE